MINLEREVDWMLRKCQHFKGEKTKISPLEKHLVGICEIDGLKVSKDYADSFCFDAFNSCVSYQRAQALKEIEKRKAERKGELFYTQKKKVEKK